MLGEEVYESEGCWDRGCMREEDARTGSVLHGMSLSNPFSWGSGNPAEEEVERVSDDGGHQETSLSKSTRFLGR